MKNNKKILIVGIASIEGIKLANLLTKKNCEISGILFNKNLLSKLEKLKITDNINIIKYNSKNSKFLKKILSRKFTDIFFYNENLNDINLIKYDHKDILNSLFIFETILKFIREEKKNKKSQFFYYFKNKITKQTSPIDLSKLIETQIIQTYKEMFKIPIYLFKDNKEILKKYFNE